ncbi:MAG: alpha-ketoacid dehydrogenase subunit beta [Dehalococcoidia bacterium]
MAEKRFIDGIREALREAMEGDDNVIVLGEDVGVKGGVFRATEGLQRTFGKHRVIDTPLAESGIVGVAIGAALNGLRPVVEIQFADFIFPAMDQIVSEAARIYYRTNGECSVPLVIRAPYGGGVHGGLYHSQSNEAFFFHVPGLKIVIPATPVDAKGLLLASIRDNNPVLFFEHKLAYNLIRGDIPAIQSPVPLGEARVCRKGARISLLSYGLSVHHCLEAAETLDREGIHCEVVDLRTLKPLDLDTILQSVRNTGKACIVHEDNLTGGIGAEIAAILSREAFEYLDGPIYRVAAPDVPSFPYSPPLEEFCLPGPDKIVAAVRELSSY